MHVEHRLPGRGAGVEHDAVAGQLLLFGDRRRSPAASSASSDSSTAARSPRRSGGAARGMTSTWFGACGLMSRKVSVRSVSRTTVAGTSPETIRQNRQSCRTHGLDASPVAPHVMLARSPELRSSGHCGRGLVTSMMVSARGESPARGASEDDAGRHDAGGRRAQHGRPEPARTDAPAIENVASSSSVRPPSGPTTRTIIPVGRHGDVGETVDRPPSCSTIALRRRGKPGRDVGCRRQLGHVGQRSCGGTAWQPPAPSSATGRVPWRHARRATGSTQRAPTTAR